MKDFARKIVRKIYRAPVIGYCFSTGISILRLPRLRSRLNDLSHRLALLEGVLRGDTRVENRLDALESQFFGDSTESLVSSVRRIDAMALDLNHRSYVEHPQQFESLQELVHKQAIFETEQLPSLLKSVADISARQLQTNIEWDNLVESIPVGMRRVKRSVNDIEQNFSVHLQEFNKLRSDVESNIGELNKSVIDISTSQTQQSQVSNLSDNVGYLLGRVEFVRRELMFQMRYSQEGVQSKDDLLATQKVIATKKVEQAEIHGAKLNLGCGHIPLDGYINIDSRELNGVDIVAEVNDLPFQRGQVKEIYSSHLLEHFPQEQLRRELLPYFFGLLAEGGTFRAVVPDADAMMSDYINVEGTSFETMREVIYGSQDYDGDFHFNMFTADSMNALLIEAGFESSIVVESGRSNGMCKEFEICAYKHAEIKNGYQAEEDECDAVI